MADDDDHFFSRFKNGFTHLGDDCMGWMENHTGSFVLSEKSAASKIPPPLDEVEEGDYVAVHNRREFS